MAGRKANSVYMLVGQIVGKAGFFVSLMIYSRILDDVLFGELLFSVAVSLGLYFLSDMGASVITTRRFLSEENSREVLVSALRLRTLLSLVSLMCLIVFSKLLSYSQSQSRLLFIVFSGFAVDGYCETFYAMFRAKEKMVFEGASRISQGILAVVVALIIRANDLNYIWIGLSYLFRSLPSLFLCISTSPPISEGTENRLSFAPVKKLFIMSLPMGLMGLILAAGQRLDNGFVKALLSDSAVAAWQQCYRLFEPLVLLVTPTLLPGALFADLCRAEMAGWQHVVKRITWMTEVFLGAALLIVIPLNFIGMNVLEIVWGTEFLRGQNYSDVQNAFRFLLVCLPVTYIFHVFLTVVLAQHRQKIVLPIASAAFLIQMTGLALFLPGRGIHIAAAMQLVFILTASISLGINARRKYGVTGFVKGATRPLTALLTVLPIFYLQPFAPLLNAITAIILFLSTWLFLGGGKVITRPPR